MKRGLLVLAVILSAAGAVLVLKKDPAPLADVAGDQKEETQGDRPKTVAQIVSKARSHRFSHSFKRVGELQDGRNAQRFDVDVDEGDSGRFEFDGKRVITVTQTPAAIQVTESVNGGNPVAIGAQRHAEQIGGSNLLIADLAQVFWDWPNPKLLEDDDVRITLKRQAWVVRFDNPDRNAKPYAVVKAWIDQEFGGLLRFEGYDSGGRKVKNAEVVKVQKDKALDRWVAEKFRLESIDHVANRKEKTTIEMDKPVKRKK